MIKTLILQWHSLAVLKACSTYVISLKIDVNSNVPIDECRRPILFVFTSYSLIMSYHNLTNGK